MLRCSTALSAAGYLWEGRRQNRTDRYRFTSLQQTLGTEPIVLRRALRTATLQPKLIGQFGDGRLIRIKGLRIIYALVIVLESNAFLDGLLRHIKADAGSVRRIQ